MPVFLLVMCSVVTICLQHLLLARLKHGRHPPIFFAFFMMGLLLYSLCLQRSCCKFLFLRNAMMGSSAKMGAIFALIDSRFQLSSIALLRFGKLLL